MKSKEKDPLGKLRRRWENNIVNRWSEKCIVQDRTQPALRPSYFPPSSLSLLCFRIKRNGVITGVRSALWSNSKLVTALELLTLPTRYLHEIHKNRLNSTSSFLSIHEQALYPVDITQLINISCYGIWRLIIVSTKSVRSTLVSPSIHMLCNLF